MTKKLILIPFLLSITVCSAKSIEDQCPPDKNYMISNPAAMEEYNQLKKEGKIKSYFYQNDNKKSCMTSYCVQFNPKIFEYKEKLFDDQYRKGVYTIYATKDLSRTDCFKDPTRKSPYCFYAIKNENDIIKSRYHLFKTTASGILKNQFYDSLKNVYLFDYSYTIYDTGALGGPGFGMCGSKNNNHPDYRFNAFSYP